MSVLVPRPVFDAFLAGKGRYSIESVPAGMSGAKVFRCTVDDGFDFALKRWPAGTAPARVAKVHRLIEYAHASNFPLVPRLVAPRRPPNQHFTGRSLREHPTRRVVRCGDFCWQATEWMLGKPLEADAPPDAIHRGAEAIALFHRSVESLETCEEPPPVVESRLQRLEQLRPLIGRLPSSIKRLPPSLFGGPERKIKDVSESRELRDLLALLQMARSLLQLKWNEVDQQITRSLLQYAPVRMTNQWVLRDVHRENVLFVDQRPTGLIDFDAVRVDVPIADLARWTGSFLAGRHDAEAVWDAAFAGFHSQSSPSRHAAREQEREPEQERHFDQGFAKSLVNASSWISLANWLVWILIEQRRFDAGPDAIRRRIEELIAIATGGLFAKRKPRII